MQHKVAKVRSFDHSGKVSLLGVQVGVLWVRPAQTRGATWLWARAWHPSHFLLAAPVLLTHISLASALFLVLRPALPSKPGQRSTSTCSSPIGGPARSLTCLLPQVGIQSSACFR